jgi:8-oxo-dGTP diphosphatase
VEEIIMKNLQSLPELYLMTGKFVDHEAFKNSLTNALSEAKKVVQFRQKNIPDDEFLALCKIAHTICQQFDCVLLLATSTELLAQTLADGLHLTSHDLFKFDSRPVSEQQILSVSCHNQAEMQQAEKLGADILLLSPVKATASHPELAGIGWEGFQQMIKPLKCPVYALGGMKVTDREDALASGAQGIAVSSFWQ